VDGLDLTRQLRGDARWNAVPIIALTARDHLNDRVAGLREGLDDYLTKPFNAKYGFAQGDVIIRAVADAIQRAVSDMEDALPGHIGGDDFVVVIPPDEAETFCRRVIQDFARLPPK